MIRFLHQYLYLLFAIIAMLVGAASWVYAPTPVPPQSEPPPPESWQLQTPVQYDSKAALDTVNKRSLWGTAATEADKAPEWRVNGITHNGSERYVLVSTEGKPLEVLKVGDELPNGLKITHIENERFFALTSDKKKIAFGIHKNEAAK